MKASWQKLKGLELSDEDLAFLSEELTNLYEFLTQDHGASDEEEDEEGSDDSWNPPPKKKSKSEAA